MKIVLDTNVLISGIFWRGNPYNILLAWKERKFDIYVSLEILEEFVKILKNFKIQMPENMLEEWINLLVENCILIEPEERFNVVSDRKDNKFIDCAVAGKVDYIVSGDSDLTELKIFMDIKIVTPREFLDIIS